MVRILILNLLLACSLALNANTDPGNIRGNITDSLSGQKVEYANVVVFRQKDSVMVTGTLSQADGGFVLKTLPKGDYYLVIQFVGYQKTTLGNIHITAEKGDLDLGNILLPPSINNIDAVEISAERSTVEYKIDKQVINAAQVMTASNGNVIELLRTSPSVTVDNDDNVYLRGSSGYLFLIDGKPTAMEKRDAMRQIAASSVESIEIITNPSAKYDAEGTSGIINIVMKKNRASGFAGLISARYGTFNCYGGNVNLSYNTKKVNTNLGISYNRDRNLSYNVNDRYSYLGDSTFVLHHRSERENTNTNGNINLGVDYNPNVHHSFSFNAGAGLSGYYATLDTRYEQRSLNNETYARMLSDYTLDLLGYYANGSLNYRLTFDTTTHYLNFSVYGMRWNGNTNEENLEFATDADWNYGLQSGGLRVPENNRMTEMNAGVDYAREWKNGLGIEVGGLYTYKPFRGNVRSTYYDNSTAQWMEAGNLSVDETFNETKYAGYATFKGKVFTIDFQTGVRSEYYKRYMALQPVNNEFNNDGFYFFPSLHLSRTFKDKFTLQASYSRRVNYPDDWALNPLPMFSDSYIIQTGNPNLQPEFIDSYELNSIAMFKTWTLSTNLFYRQNNNALSRLFVMHDDGIMEITFDNMNHERYAGIELNANFQFTKNFGTNISGSAWWQQNQGQSGSENVDLENFSYNARAFLNYKFLKNSRMQLTVMYNGPALHNNGKMKGFAMADLSLRQDFLKQKLSLSVNFKDILHSFRFDYKQNGVNYDMTMLYRSYYPVLSVGLSYKINNYHYKPDNKAGNVGTAPGGGL
jgi:outer membrane receptor protein involved in Fe transport